MGGSLTAAVLVSLLGFFFFQGMLMATAEDIPVSFVPQEGAIYRVSAIDHSNPRSVKAPTFLASMPAERLMTLPQGVYMLEREGPAGERTLVRKEGENDFRVYVYFKLLYDSYTTYGYEEGTVWEGGNIQYQCEGPYGGNCDTYEVMCVDYYEDYQFDECWGRTSTLMNACKNKITEIYDLCSSQSWMCHSSGVSSSHWFDSAVLESAATFGNTMYVFYNCTTPTARWYSDYQGVNVIDRIRSYTGYNQNRWEVRGRTDSYHYIDEMTCESGKVRDDSIVGYISYDDDYRYENDYPHYPCRLSDGQQCTQGSECLTGHFCACGKCNTTTVCCGNSICDGGENYSSCPQDCPNPCPYPNGTSEDCECDSDPDCTPYGDMYCHQQSGWDPCLPVIHTNECQSAGTFFCENGWVKKCVSQGSYNVKVPIEDCNGRYKYCDPLVVDGGNCSTTQHDVWIDYADTGVKVNKQAGDIIEMNIFLQATGSVNVQYDTDTFSSECFGQRNLPAGTWTCSFTVQEDAQPGIYTLWADDKPAMVEVISSPDFLVVTHSENLRKHYPNEQAGVDAVLKQAYWNAVDRGVVYDLALYDLGVVHPFSLYGDYHEKLSAPTFMDNLYAVRVSEFVVSHCQSCREIMVIGDDFVLPSYRSIAPVSKGLSLFGITNIFERQEDVPIYTDASLIPRNVNTLQFKDMPYVFAHYNYKHHRLEEKTVVFIIPEAASADLLLAIRDLENTIETKYNASIEEKQSSAIRCDSLEYFDTLRTATPVIIGDREHNQAFSCYPFLDFLSNSVSLELNVWDSDEPAVLITSMNPNITANFNLMVQDDIVDYIAARSMTMTDKLLMVGGAVAIGGTIVAAAAGAPVIAAGAGIVAIVAAGTSVSNECIIKNEGGRNWVMCAVDVGVNAAGGLLGKGVAKVAFWAKERFIAIGGDAAVRLMTKYSDDVILNLKKLMTSHWGGERYEAFMNFLRRYREMSDIADDFYKYVARYNGFEKQTLKEFEILDEYVDYYPTQNPFKNSVSDFDLVGAFESPNTRILINGHSIDESARLLEGNVLTNRGWRHIVADHVGLAHTPGKTAFIKIVEGQEEYMNEQEVMDLIKSALKTGWEDTLNNNDPENVKLIVLTLPEGSYRRGIRVIVDKNDGEVISAYLTNQIQDAP
ncbi:MAG: hypothetical protein V1735_03410 [Nanoarchaeota archaeon]